MYLNIIIDKIIDNKLNHIYINNYDFADENSGNLKKLCTLCCALKSNTNVEKISFHKCHFNITSIKYISDMLKENSNIKILNICDTNKMNELLGVKYISEMLKQNITLTHLNFSYSNLTSESIKCICDALKFNISIEILELFNCNIGNDGVKYISDMLKGNYSLQHLNIGANHIDIYGAKLISGALQVNNTLNILYMISIPLINYEQFNSIFYDTLKYNSSITDLGSYNNALTLPICERNKYNRYQKSITLMELQ